MSMNILAIDTSAITATAAVMVDSSLVAAFSVNLKMEHSTRMLPMIDTVLSSAGLKPTDIDLFAVSAGPGSFTGLRIGISTIKGLAFPFNTPCAAVSTLEALAYNLAFAGNMIICPVMDARRNEFYNALFTVSDSKGTLVRLTPDRAISADALFDELFATGKAVLLNGDGAKKLYNIFSNKCAQEGRNFTYKLAPEHLIYQNAATVALLGEKSMSEGNKLAPAMLSPVYLRESGAERTKKSNEIGVNEK